jgi:hypothetical protein
MTEGSASRVRVALNEEACAALVAGEIVTMRGYTADGVVSIEIILSGPRRRRQADRSRREALMRKRQVAPGEPNTPQNLGITLLRLVATLEALRKVVGASDVVGFDRGMVDALAAVNQIEPIPGELMLACEILAEELDDTEPAQMLLVELWFVAFDEIERKKVRFDEAMTRPLPTVVSNADSRH